MEYLLILMSLLFTTSGQLFQKQAALKADALDHSSSFTRRILKQPETWWAILCLGIGMMVWLAVLYYMEVSKAVPFLSLGYVLVLLISHYYFHEIIRPTRWAGVLFIILGTYIVGVS